MRLIRCFLGASLMVGAGLMLGCGDPNAGKPMKDMKVVPGPEEEREMKLKGGKTKPQPAEPAGGQIPPADK